MGKNSGADRVGTQTQQAYDESSRRSASMEEWLKGLFGPAYGNAQNWMGDAYNKFGDIYGQYGDMYGDYGEVARTGLIDPQGQEARDLYSNFIKTGGFSDQDKATFRARAVAPVRGMYASLADTERNQRTINPYAPGFTQRMAKISRQGGQQIGETGIGAEANLSSQIRQNQLAGASGATDFWGRLTGNKLAGMSGQMGALGGQMGATQGIAGLGTAEMGFAAKLIDAIGANNALDAQTKTALLGILTQQNPRVSLWDRIMQIGQLLAQGAATAVGAGAFGGHGFRINQAVS